MLLLAPMLLAAASADTGLLAAWHSNAVLAPSAAGPGGHNCSGTVPSLSLNFTASSGIACEGPGRYIYRGFRGLT